MIVKTKAVLIHHLRHSDNSLIVHFYTREYGRLSVVARGVSSRKGRAKFAYFQPLYIFDLELYYRDTRELHTLKEINLAYTPLQLPVDVYKSTIAMFLSEMLFTLIREEDVNRDLFDFIESSVITLDTLTEGISNFHLWFLSVLSGYIGIGPTPSKEGDFLFDMLSGHFVTSAPHHTDFLDRSEASVFSRLLTSAAEDLPGIMLSGEERSSLLNRIIRYYNIHLPGMRNIRSLQVLNDVFRQV